MISGSWGCSGRKLDTEFVNKVRQAKSQGLGCTNVESLLQRIINWFRGVDSKQYTLPLVVLMNARTDYNHKGAGLHACRSAMEHFNGLKRTAIKGDDGPKIYERLEDDHANEGRKVHIFEIQLRNSAGKMELIELGRVRAAASEKVAKSVRELIAKKEHAKMVTQSTPYQVMNRISGCFSSDQRGLNLLIRLANDEDIEAADKTLFELRQECIDTRVRFKVSVMNMPTEDKTGQLKYKRNYWVVYDGNDLACIKKGAEVALEFGMTFNENDLTALILDTLDNEDLHQREQEKNRFTLSDLEERQRYSNW
ncbi:hypothetical protein D5R81_19140 [Parashewanella spongiae]|uniref:Uncharacterized protein n=1 Tax=Parashewanella spongiae TaxID=342950 RepID=A0A3A6TBZ4_9GAMM|nr:hypothetical protein [Parashewanella spongiae]MCL1080162.1 hypothetical protein [Parashewanella spongiae]RJY02505.1 hypothetical protein D5R81_19140 [Parashewanella spongiae]